jgi:hypothetical protein
MASLEATADTERQSGSVATETVKEVGRTCQQQQSPTVYGRHGPYRSFADIPRDVCYNCLKRGHRIADCRAPRRPGWERRDPPSPMD